MTTLTITPETTVETISNFLYAESDKRMDFDKNANYIRNFTRNIPASAYCTKHLFGFWMKANKGVITLERY